MHLSHNLNLFDNEKKIALTKNIYICNIKTFGLMACQPFGGGYLMPKLVFFFACSNMVSTKTILYKQL